MATAPEQFDEPLFTINRPTHVGPCCLHYQEPAEPNRLVEWAKMAAAATVLMGVGALAAVGLLTILVLTVFHGNPLA